MEAEMVYSISYCEWFMLVKVEGNGVLIVQDIEVNFDLQISPLDMIDMNGLTWIAKD